MLLECITGADSCGSGGVKETPLGRGTSEPAAGRHEAPVSVPAT
jgi:hypothetical protein